MTVHTDTNRLQKYTVQRSPTIPGGDVQYLSNQLSLISLAISNLVDVVKLMEARMNTNGLT